MPATTRRTTEFLDSLAADLRQVRETVDQRFRPLTDDQLNRGPGPGKWSVGQCLEHLNIVGGLYLPVIGKKIKAAQERGSKPADTIVHGFFGKRMTDAMRVPASEKAMKSPQQYAPSGFRLPRTVLEVFSRQLDELTGLIEQTRGVNANAIRIPNPIIPLLLPRLTDALELLVVHMQRHITQAEAVLDGQLAAKNQAE